MKKICREKKRSIENGINGQLDARLREASYNKLKTGKIRRGRTNAKDICSAGSRNKGYDLVLPGQLPVIDETESKHSVVSIKSYIFRCTEYDPA